MKKILYTILIASFAGTACQDDVLNKTPLVNQTTETFFKTEADAYAALIAAYSSLNNLRYISAKFILGDISSDDATKGSKPSDATYMSEVEDFRVTSSNNAVWWHWFPMWNGIYASNLVIKHVGNAEINEDTKNLYVAEAKFLRAYYYFELVKNYGGMPLFSEPKEGVELQTPRSTREETYAFIETDLLDAMNYLENKSVNGGGRATLGAAAALLGKAYLYQQKFTEAEAMLSRFTTGDQVSEYSLEPDYARIFTVAGENGSGSVFEMQFADNGNSDTWDQAGNFSTVFTMPRLWGWGFNQPKQDLVDEFESGDPRLQASIMTYDEAQAIEETDPNWDGAVISDDQTGYYQKKNYLYPNQRPGWWRESEVNYRAIRLSDVYLMYAEAANEIGKSGEALTWLNKVRERARGGNAAILPDVTVADKESLREAIYHERRVELAMEHHRFYDLVRTGRAQQELGQFGFVPGTHEIYPIPQGDIDKSGGLLDQNPNY